MLRIEPASLAFCLLCCSCWTSSAISFHSDNATENEHEELVLLDEHDEEVIDVISESVGEDLDIDEYLDSDEDLQEVPFVPCEDDYVWLNLDAFVSGEWPGISPGNSSCYYRGYLSTEKRHLFKCKIRHYHDEEITYSYAVVFLDDEFHLACPPFELVELGDDNETYGGSFLFNDPVIVFILNKSAESPLSGQLILYMVSLEGEEPALIGQTRIDEYFDWEVTRLHGSYGAISWTGSEYHIRYHQDTSECPSWCYHVFISRHMPDGELIDIVEVEPFCQTLLPEGLRRCKTYLLWFEDSYLRLDKIEDDERKNHYFVSHWDPDSGQVTEPVQVDFGDEGLNILRFYPQVWTGSEYIAYFLRVVPHGTGAYRRFEMLRLDRDLNPAGEPEIIRDAPGIYDVDVWGTDGYVNWNGYELMVWVQAFWWLSGTVYFGDTRLFRLNTDLDIIQEWILYEERFRPVHGVHVHGMGIARVEWLGDRYFTSRTCLHREDSNCFDYLICDRD